MRIGVGAGSSATWVAADGGWRNGPLHGRWSKVTPQHIGQAARERHRLQQIDALDAQIAEADASAARLRSAIDNVEQRIEQARREARQAPDDELVRKALAERAAAGRRVGEQRGRVGEAERRVHERRQALQAAEEERDRDAADLGIAAWVDRLDELREATDEYRHATGQFWPAFRSSVDARRHADRCGTRTAEAEAQVHMQAGRLRTAANELRAAEAHRDTLEASVGKSARDIRARLEEARRQVGHLRKEREAAGKEDKSQHAALAVAEQKVETHAEAMGRHQADRAEAIESLASLGRLKLLPVISAELAHEQGEPASVSRAVDLARQIESLLSDVRSDEEAWAKHQREVHRHIQNLTDALLPHDLRPQTTTLDNLLIVTVVYDQRDCSMLELRDALAEDAHARRSLLEEQERRVLEQTLIDEVATHLHDRLHEAERLVADMNEQITSRPMSTGMRIKFVWEPMDDGPAGLPDARRRLLGVGATWSPDDRGALGQFLHAQIQAMRTANETATWQQHIEEAFDYRRWHRFAVMRQQDGKWQRLTRRTHGTGSGGEKAVALTLPMFAAAAAHYQSADPLAPRPILLDEVFAGIDSDMRGKCMGLLNAFDLDFIMTSEREWGCYAEMPGVAIYQLTTMKGIDAVLATRWLWNGRQRTRSEPPPLDKPRVTSAGDDDGMLL
ncbi:MAG: TIGR02680 family protein [Phycisphaeraceae bacterium]